jgi:hypothetical protein
VALRPFIATNSPNFKPQRVSSSVAVTRSNGRAALLTATNIRSALEQWHSPGDVTFSQ